jgi:hypothetical protein
VEWHPESGELTTFEGRIEAARIWTGEDERDAHLRAPTSSTSKTTPDLVRGRFTARVGGTTSRRWPT